MKLILVLLLLSCASAKETHKNGSESINTQQQNQIEEQTKLQKKAIEDARQEVLAHPDSAEAHFQLAETLFKGPRTTKEDGEIVKEYLRAIQLKPDYAEAYCGLAFFSGMRGDYKESFEAFDKAISLKPDYADAYCKLGFAHLETNWGKSRQYPDEKREAELAAKAFRKAVQIKPDFSMAYAGLGDATYRLKMYEESLEAFKQAVLIDPNNIIGHAGLGLIYIQLGNKFAAMQEYEALNQLATQEQIMMKEAGLDSFPNLSKGYADRLLKEIQRRFGDK